MAESISPKKIKVSSLSVTKKKIPSLKKNPNDNQPNQKPPQATKSAKRLSMVKQQSFDPTVATKQGIFRGRTTFSLTGQRPSTFSDNRPMSAKSFDHHSQCITTDDVNIPPVKDALATISDLQSAPQTVLNDYPSATTITTSPTSTVMHKPGKVPAYLNKINKYTLESELNAKRKVYANLKRTLAQNQTAVMDMYRTVVEIQSKVNKLNGKHCTIEKLKLVAYDDNDNNYRYLCESNNEQIEQQSSMQQPLKQQLSIRDKEDVPTQMQQSDIHLFEEQMRKIHGSGFGLCHTIIEHTLNVFKEIDMEPIEPIDNFVKEKLINFLEDKKAKIAISEFEQNESINKFIAKLKKIIEKHKIESEKKTESEKTHSHDTDLRTELDLKIKEIRTLQTKLSQAESSMDVLKKELDTREFELNETVERNCSIIREFENNWIKLEGMKSHDEIQRRFNASLQEELERKNGEIKNLSDRLQREIDQRHKIEQEVDGLKETIISLQDKNARDSEENVMKIEELEETKKALKLLEMERSREAAEEFQLIDEMKESIEASVQQIESLKLENSIKTEQIQKISKDFLQEQDLRMKLELDLKEFQKSIELLKAERAKEAEENGRKTETIKNVSELLRIENDNRIKLEKDLSGAQVDIENLKQQIANVKDRSTDVSTRDSDASLISSAKMQDLLTQLNRQDRKISQQNSIIERLEGILKTKSQEINEERQQIQKRIIELKESEALKNDEMDKLRKDLRKAENEIKQQEETIFAHQRCLRVRGELIETLQQSDQTTQCRMAEIYQEIQKKSTMMDRMETEVSAKAEELQNIFSTLTTKQMKVMRQEKIIEMLEANAERSRKIRARQLEKISALETENVQLRKYLEAERESSGNASVEESSVECCDEKLNQSLFDQERRKKRVNQISVKKYCN